MTTVGALLPAETDLVRTPGSSTGSGWIDSGQFVSLTTSTDTVGIGNTSAVSGRKLTVQTTGTDQGIRVNALAGTDNALDVRIVGEANDTFQMRGDGSHHWGAGGATALASRMYYAGVPVYGTPIMGLDDGALGSCIFAVGGDPNAAIPTGGLVQYDTGVFFLYTFDLLTASTAATADVYIYSGYATNSGAGNTPVSSGSITAATGDTDSTGGGQAGDSGAFIAGTGNALSTSGTSSGNSGQIFIATGDSADKNSGDFVVQVGAAPNGTVGSFKFRATKLDSTNQATQWTVIDNTSNAFQWGSTGLLNAIVFDSTNSAEKTTFNCRFATASAVYASITDVAVAASPYTVVATDYIVAPVPSSGDITVVLPAISANRGRVLYVKHTVGNGNIVTVTPNGSDTIDDSSSKTLTTNMSIMLVAPNSGTDWMVM